MKVFFAAVALLAAFTVPAQAVPISITAVTYDVPVTSPMTVDANLTSVTAGATTYTFLTGPDSVTNLAGGNGGNAFYSATGTDPGTSLAAMSDGPGPGGLNATTGSNGIGNGVVVDFAQNVDGGNLFLTDLGGADMVTVLPLDSSGTPIGDFTLTVASGGGGSYGTISWNIGAATGTSTLQGVLFNTSDFSGTGALTGVEGIQLTGASLDLMAVGIASVIPEPSSLALLLIGVCGMALRRRES